MKKICSIMFLFGVCIIGIGTFLLQGSAHNKNSKALNKEQITQLRKQYPLHDGGNPMLDTAIPSDYSLTPVDLQEWSGKIEELEELNPSLVETKMKQLYII